MTYSSSFSPDEYLRTLYRRAALAQSLGTPEADWREDEINDWHRYWDSVASISASPEFNEALTPLWDNDDDKILEQALGEHGVLFDAISRRVTEQRIAAKLERSPDAKRAAELALGVLSNDRYMNQSLPVYWPDVTGGLVSVIHGYCRDVALLRLRSDVGVMSRFREWMAVFDSPQPCVMCGTPFRLSETHVYTHARMGGYRHCCPSCPITARPWKKEMKHLVPAFVDACGFIPNANAGPYTYSFTSRLSEHQWPVVMRAWAAMGGTDWVKEKFGTWFTALVSTGVLPDGVQRTARGIRCLAKDGHVCHSLDEQRIDNWFHDNGIAHEREPHYPYHDTLNPTGGLRADWKLGPVYVEYFGLAGDKKYDAKTMQKTALAAATDVDLFPIFPSDMKVLEETLRRLQAVLGMAIRESEMMEP